MRNPDHRDWRHQQLFSQLRVSRVVEICAKEKSGKQGSLRFYFYSSFHLSRTHFFKKFSKDILKTCSIHLIGAPLILIFHIHVIGVRCSTSFFILARKFDFRQMSGTIKNLIAV
jgi:hypothetical protein